MHLNTILLAALTLSLSSYSYSYTHSQKDSSLENNKLDDNQGWYVGTSMGNARFNYKGGSDDVFFSGAYWGINFIDAFGLESTLIATTDESKGVKNTFLALTITPKINIQLHRRFSLYMKGGVALSIQVADFNDEEEDDMPSWSGSIPTYGFGGEFRIIEGLEARLSYDNIKGKLAHDDNSSFYTFQDADIDLDLVTVGIHYQF